MILHEIHSEGVVSSKTFQVATIIEKSSPIQKDFKNYLKHKGNDMNIKNLIVRLRIREDNKIFDKRIFSQATIKANVVEHSQKLEKEEPYIF